MNVEEIVNCILSSRSDLNRQQILEMIENKKQSAGNFLTDETAARITATELGIEITKKPPKLKIQIKDLVCGLNDATITAQVTAIYPPKTFKKRDLTEGKLANLIVKDQTGTLRVVLWDDKTDLIQTKNIQQNQTIKILHAYVRQGLDGKPELHLGQKGNIKIIKEN